MLDPDEVVTEIQIPKPQDGARQKYLKFTLRTPIDFAIVSVVSVITIERGSVCGCPYRPWGRRPNTHKSAEKAEQTLRGKAIDPKTAEEAARAAVIGAKPLSLNAYKIEETRVLVRRALIP